MNKDELITKLKTHFFGVDEAGIDTGGHTLDGIKVWGIKVFELVGDVITRKNITFYTKDDIAYWGNFDPNLPAPESTFSERANAFLASKIADETIKFGYVEQVSESTQKASVSAITINNVSKKAIISEVAGVFSIDILDPL